MMWNPGWGWGGMPWAWFTAMHVLWWVLLVAGAVIVFRAVAGRRPRDRALDLLRERFARGEIDQAEYDERRRQLQG
jgi:putative membrane protein